MTRARLARLAMASVLAAGVLAASPAPARASSSPRPACMFRDSWVAGTTEICVGGLVYHDYVHDDYGADTGEYMTESTGSLSPTAGDERYPEGQVNTADLVRLTIRPVRGRLWIEAELNALFRPDDTILAVAFDTDTDPSTGGGAWGDLDVASDGWDVMAFFDRGDPRSNTIRGTMARPPGRRWRVQAVTANRATGSVMNVAFRGPDERARFAQEEPDEAADSAVGAWFEDDQAAALGEGDISRFGHTVNVADLLRGRTRPPSKVGPGLHERVYTSAYTLPPGEGMTYEGVPGRGDGGGGAEVGFEQAFHYLGRYQPYGIYIPRTPAPWGVQYVYHGTGANFSSLINQGGMQTEFGENLDRLLVVPEVRGPDGYGSDISEADILDVMRDVERNYPVDRSRVFAGGYSQGGYLAYRMAALYPDRFAGTVPWVGFTGNSNNGSPAPAEADYTAGAVGNAIDLIGNLRHVPAVMVSAGGDYLVHAWTTLAMDRAFAASDNRYRWYLYPAAEHLTFALADDWSQEAGDTADLRLVRNPARVTYRTAPFLGSPAYGIRHDRAYWVSDIRGRGEGWIDVDVTSHGCGGTEAMTETGQDAGVATLPWVRDFRWQSGTEPMHRAPRLEGSLGNVRSLRIDVRSACLAGRTFTYDLTTDGPAQVVLTDGRVLRLPGPGRRQGSLPAP